MTDNEQQRRRVSAPSDPPVSQDPRINRNRRNRHWRLKNRAAENAGSRTTPASISASGTSGEASADDIAPPVSSPAAGAPQKLSAKPKITFGTS